MDWIRALMAAGRAWDTADGTNTASATLMLRRACEAQDLAAVRLALVGAENAARDAGKWTGVYQQAISECAAALDEPALEVPGCLMCGRRGEGSPACTACAAKLAKEPNPGRAIAELIHLDHCMLAPTVARIIEDLEGSAILPTEDAYGALDRARGRLELMLAVVQAEEARAVARDRKRQEANGEAFKDYGFMHSPHVERAAVIRAALAALQGTGEGE